MSIIKGQNLRLFEKDSERVFAMSTNCAVHIALQLEQFSTKDDVDDWVRQQPVGHAWDCNVDALVAAVDGGMDETNTDIGEVEGVRLYGVSTSIQLHAGKRIVAALTDNLTSNDIYITSTPPSPTVYAEGEKKVEYINTGSTPITVLIASKVNNAPVIYHICDADALTLEDLEIGQKIKLAFAIAEDDMNRQMGEGLLTGTAIINDISINAGNRQNVSYTLQMQGDGMLSRMSN